MPEPQPVRETPPADTGTPKVVDLDMASALSAYAVEYPIASAVATSVIDALAGADLSPLANRSPSLAGYDWSNYLRCSIVRVVRVQRALSTFAGPGARVLDYGSYFGNFGLTCRAMGFEVSAIDSYRQYGTAFAPWEALQRRAGITVHDFADTGYDLKALPAGGYDAVICAGVLEHMPHSPKPLLDSLDSALRPGGVLILDTPNLGYLYKRLAMIEGQSIFAPIADQYFTAFPFEGHHREYTVAEVEWLLGAVGHEILGVETFNYSMFGTTSLAGEHAEYFHAMSADPLLRELTITVSRKPVAVPKPSE